MTDVLRELILPKLEMVRPTGGQFQARCPAHEDNSPSLSLAYGTEQPVILKCHAGCDSESILDAIGLTWADLSKPREERAEREVWTPAGPAIALYDYVDAAGKLVYQVTRTAEKQFRQRRPDPSAKSGWAWNLQGVTPLPYRLPKVIEHVAAGREIWVCEGEKDVHALEQIGLVATCNSGGAGKWTEAHSGYLLGASMVCIIADADDPGRAHARRVFDSLAGRVDLVQIYEAPKHKDVSAHLGAGLDLADLELTQTSEDTSGPVLAPDLWEFISQEDEPYDWLVPGLIERGDRLMVTGAEGLGKSVFCRQLAVQLAAGVHPFTGADIDPVRVLIIDCENLTRQNRRHYRTLAAVSVKKGRRVPDGGLRLIHRSEGIDLTLEEDADWFLERIRAHKPDAVYVGPWYRLHAADMNAEMPARQVVRILDKARNIGDGCTLIMEAHAGHEQPGQKRNLRPTGSSLLRRWPEFGFGLQATEGADLVDDRPTSVDVVRWRLPRDNRDWPVHLTYGAPGDWPWQPFTLPPKKSNLGDASAAALSARNPNKEH